MPFSDPKARDYLETLRAMPPRDRIEWCKVIPEMSKFEDMLLDAGCSLNEIDELVTEVEFYRTTEHAGESSELIAALSASLTRPAENSTVDALIAIEDQRKPRFRTGVGAVDHMTYGGGYGLTTIGGDAKVGKTMFAIGLAVEAAKEGWRVVYINAELDRSEAILAAMRYCGGDIPAAVHDMMTLVSPDFTFDPVAAVSRVKESVGLDDSRILVVLDSINALVDLSSDGSGATLDYWAANSLWRNFAVRTTRMTLGKVAFAVVSETNKEGGIKGRNLEYKSDLVVRISRDKEDESMVSIDVTHSRTTPSGELGRFKRNWLAGRFELCG